MYRFKQAELLKDKTNSKLLYQYMGGTLNDYVLHLTTQSGQGPVSSFLPPAQEGSTPFSHDDIIDAWRSAIDLLAEDAGALLDQSMHLGMDKPIALFARAAISINIGTREELERAVDLLEAVIKKNKELSALEKQGVPVEDTISIENAYNQRALALMNLKRYEEAESHFIMAAEINPLLWESYINLGSLYFETNRPEMAKEVLHVGSLMYQKSTDGPLHLTFMIQLGYAEELQGHYQLAYDYYNKGLQLVQEFVLGGFHYDQNHAVKLQNNADKMLKLLS
jgi:tetratricopeptide (TPR) repeat protein